MLKSQLSLIQANQISLKAMRYIVRCMQEKDIPQAIEIDREAFPTQWPRPTINSFKQELHNRLACYLVISRPEENQNTKQNPEVRGFLHKLRHLFDRDGLLGADLATSSKEYILGIAGFWTMVDEAHITTLATRRACRQQGIGERLLLQIIELAAKLRADVVTLEVRITNKQAQTLYEKYGFQKVGIRRAYYTDNGEDAIIMTTDSLNSGDFQSRLQKLRQAHKQKWGLFHENEELSHLK